MANSFGARSELEIDGVKHSIFSLATLAAEHEIDTLPYSLRVLLENVLRHEGTVTSAAQVEAIAGLLESRGLPVKRPLERMASDEQKSLGRGDRGANARKAYTLRAGERSPELPLLLDDVVTTCATLDACARAVRIFRSPCVSSSTLGRPTRARASATRCC